MVAPTSPASTRPDPSGHVVGFYGDDAQLIPSVAEDLALALGDDLDGAAIVIATPPHVDALESQLRRAGVDVERMAATGRLICLDAASVLEAISVGGSVDRERFTSVVGGLVDRAGAGRRHVRAFGEMVDLLWDAGDLEQAIALEGLWNDLAERRRFHLHCAYRVAADVASLAAVRAVCHAHTAVVGPPTGALRPTSSPGAEPVTRFFAPVPAAVPAVRALVRQALPAWHRVDLIPDVELVATELGANVLIHARSPFRLTLSQVGAGIRVDVHDGDPAPPGPRTAPADATSGRGLQIVAALAHRWGTEHGPDGKVVWAELLRSAFSA